MHLTFHPSPARTVGAEWELGLLDPVTGDLVSRADALLERLGQDPPAAQTLTAPDGPAARTAGRRQGPSVTKELLLNTVELVTGVCANAPEAAQDLGTLLDRVRPAADALGIDLFCAGSHPFARWERQVVSPGRRYATLIDRTQWWGRQMLIYGLHVHVGVTSAAKVWPLLNAMLAYSPHLAALSASSPFWAGLDTGYASNRAMMFQQLPTAGLPFQFPDWRSYERYLDDVHTTGVVDDVSELRWDLRPSPRIGTLETRVCDGVSTLDEVVALTALTHCLVVHLDDRLDSGSLPTTLPPWHVQENKWRAARYGLDAVVVLDVDNREERVTTEVLRLLDELTPVARRLGCTEELRGVEAIVTGGAGYQRQRAVAAAAGGDLHAVTQALVTELRDGPQWLSRER